MIGYTFGDITALIVTASADVGVPVLGLQLLAKVQSLDVPTQVYAVPPAPAKTELEDAIHKIRARMDTQENLRMLKFVVFIIILY